MGISTTVSAYFDIEYPSGFVPVGEIKLDGYLANARSGIFSKLGLINELGGFGGLDYPEHPKIQTLAIIPMRAIAAGQQSISLDPADVVGHDLAFHDLDNAILFRQTQFKSRTITVESASSTTEAIDSIHAGLVPWEVSRSPAYGKVEDESPPVAVNAPASDIAEPQDTSVVSVGTACSPPFATDNGRPEMNYSESTIIAPAGQSIPEQTAPSTAAPANTNAADLLAVVLTMSDSQFTSWKKGATKHGLKA
jgi:hypothetical protein